MFTGPNSPKKEGREGKAMQVNVDHVAVRHDCSVEQHHKSQIEVESPHAGFGLGRTTERLADKKHPSGYNDSARRGAPDPRLQSLSEITLLGERPTPWGSNHRSNTLQQGSRIYLSSPRGTYVPPYDRHHLPAYHCDKPSTQGVDTRTVIPTNSPRLFPASVCHIASAAQPFCHQAFPCSLLSSQGPRCVQQPNCTSLFDARLLHRPSLIATHRPAT
ncbi:uncharacterized protein BDZ83DRAFT_627446 [Colletotrichum acutatum]|uniref:Uncharacterized protein n=1 Tax=Glomerella acutata TaxID=27357 RepID=A0AAD8XCT5_GLOAC|nr:uncharacterized protein BDZ83DRAFT_627446 [Colletotrichum acutatum]KAK1722999.1 hypothetical protein BDZ83DRAFT_627446 [Colletotrichum acutatum]